MQKKHAFKFPIGLLLVLLVWLSWPIYSFYAYRGHVPLLPYGFLTIPTSATSSQVLSDTAYKTAGDKALQSLVEHRQAISAPGISAAVAVDGALVWTGAAGWAGIETDKPVSPDTQFRIGSTSKALTATALARLVQSGRIDLDSPIASYMDNLPNPQWSEITPRQLASHMTGLPDYKDNRDWLGLYHTLALRRHYASVFDSLDVFDGMPLLYPPGSRFHYTTFNTVLLSAVMSAAASQPYRSLMQQEVFTPLEMMATAPEPKSPNDTMATYYWRDGQTVKPWRHVDLSHRLAGGGFISTPSDLVKLGSAWLDADYISATTRELFWQPQQLSTGEVNPQHYALGWRFHSGDDAIPTNANHGGVSRGSQCWLMVIPDQQMVIAVMINAGTEEFWDFGKIAITLANHFQQNRE